MSSLPVSDTISNRIWLKNTAGNFRQCFFVFICRRQLFRRHSSLKLCHNPFLLLLSFQIYSDLLLPHLIFNFPFLAHFPTFPRPFPLSNSFLSLSLTTLSLRHPHPPLSLPYSLTTLSLPSSYSTLSLPCLTRQSPPCIITVKETPMEQISTRYFKIFYTKLPHYVESENNLKYSTP